MHHTLQAIVLQSVKYGETSRVLKCYTDLFGLQSYMVNGVNGKKSSIRAGMTLPLTQLTLVATHKARVTLERIKEATVATHYEQIYSDPMRNAMALFLAEVLQKCLRTEQGDADKFNFVANHCSYLDAANEVPAHFPQYFLIELSRYLGFYPHHAGTQRCQFFDCVEGVFSDLKPLHPYYFNEESTHALQLLMQKLEIVEQLKIPKSVRKLLLHDLILFYRTQFSDFGNIKSIEVLEEIFS